MFTLHLLALSLLVVPPRPVVAEIQAAFLENSPALFRELLPAERMIPLSLPEPLSLADQLSPDQVDLAFRRFFAVFKTTEFTIDPRAYAVPGSPGGILRSRWSFLDKKTGRTYTLNLYFFVVPERRLRPAGATDPLGASKIVEIRAEGR